jgi:hypothetical protein
MTVPKPTEKSPTTTHASEALPALPAKRARRRSTRGSHSWRFRRPPSRKRVEIATARRLPEGMPTPPQAPDLYPINDNCN